MKILPIYTEALRGFGYTEEESRFLYLVATHSGYFTCRQFLQCVGTKPGKRSVAFARKMVEKKHASSKEYLRHGRVFHLFSRNLYEAIGRENVRFRRVHSTEYIPNPAHRTRFHSPQSGLQVPRIGRAEALLLLRPVGNRQENPAPQALLGGYQGKLHRPLFRGQVPDVLPPRRVSLSCGDLQLHRSWV